MMRNLFVPLIIASLAVPGVALAQSPPSTSGSAGASQPSGQSGSTQPNQLANAQRIKQDLEKAGFSDVRIVAESFVVQAKSKDGDPVLMTIGPRGFTLFEAENLGKASTTGSTSSGSAGTGSSNSASGASHK